MVATIPRDWHRPTGRSRSAVKQTPYFFAATSSANSACSFSSVIPTGPTLRSDAMAIRRLRHPEFFGLLDGEPSVFPQGGRCETCDLNSR